MNEQYTAMQWLSFGLLLILQNLTFTMVSRARNSASLLRHVLWGVGSNGVWFLTQAAVFTHFLKAASGNLGTEMQIMFGLYYTFMTVLGAVAAHWWALNSEKGKSAVGANKRYAQITNQDWEGIWGDLRRVRHEHGDWLLEMQSKMSELQAELEKRKPRRVRDERGRYAPKTGKQPTEIVMSAEEIFEELTLIDGVYVPVTFQSEEFQLTEENAVSAISEMVAAGYVRRTETPETESETTLEAVEEKA
jgi:hypothetical protein